MGSYNPYWYQKRDGRDRKSTRLNSSHLVISYAVFCLKKKKDNRPAAHRQPHLCQRTHTADLPRHDRADARALDVDPMSELSAVLTRSPHIHLCGPPAS